MCHCHKRWIQGIDIHNTLHPIQRRYLIITRDSLMSSDTLVKSNDCALVQQIMDRMYRSGGGTRGCPLTFQVNGA